jgi:hypothetical protein
MLAFVIVLAAVLAAVIVWRSRVRLVAKLLGQSEARIDRQLGGRS